jgi:hypothetical protein
LGTICFLDLFSQNSGQENSEPINNDLNMMDRNAGLPEGFSASTELGNAHGEIQHFRF